MRQNPHVRICGGPGSATTLVYPTVLWPFLRPLVTEATAKGSTPESGAGKGSQRSRETNEQRTSSRLPLGNSRK